MFEAKAVQWKDVDFENHLLHIYKQCNIQNKNNFVLSTPKTKKSVRTVVMSKSLENFLKEYKTMKLETFNNIDELFVAGDMIPIPNTTIKKRRQKHFQKCNLLCRTNHEFRHSYGSIRLSDGFDLKYVSEQMGHSSIAVTISTYHHILKNVYEKNADLAYNKY